MLKWTVILLIGCGSIHSTDLSVFTLRGCGGAWKAGTALAVYFVAVVFLLASVELGVLTPVDFACASIREGLLKVSGVGGKEPY